MSIQRISELEKEILARQLETEKLKKKFKKASEKQVREHRERLALHTDRLDQVDRSLGKYKDLPEKKVNGGKPSDWTPTPTSTGSSGD